MRNIKLLDEKRIKENLGSFENGLLYAKDEGRHPMARYASFDYCFNYFQGFKNKKDIASKENIQNSCLHLAFYLASWGMLRGSSFLLQKSIKFYEPLIEYISQKDEDFWKIDVDNYNKNDNLEKLITCYKDIKEKLKDEKSKNRASDTLITKIMLGVFGNVPAFDNYFKVGSSLGIFNKRTLKQIIIFYNTNNYKDIISGEAKKVKTFEYYDGIKSKRQYTKAKIIDMIFFIEGYRKDKK